MDIYISCRGIDTYTCVVVKMHTAIYIIYIYIDIHIYICINYIYMYMYIYIYSGAYTHRYIIYIYVYTYTKWIYLWHPPRGLGTHRCKRPRLRAAGSACGQELFASKPQRLQVLCTEEA